MQIKKNNLQMFITLQSLLYLLFRVQKTRFLIVPMEFIFEGKTTVPLLKLSVASSLTSATQVYKEPTQAEAVPRSPSQSGQAKPCGPSHSHRKGNFNPATATPQREDREDYTAAKGGQDEGRRGEGNKRDGTVMCGVREGGRSDV